MLISGLDLPPFIVTLGMMELARGMSYTVTAGQPIYTLPAGFLAISGRVRGIPLVAPIYEPKMNAYLEETVAKYLHLSDDYISLTEIARKFDAKNPSYLIQSWLRNRNTVKFLATWERNNNPDFNEVAFEKLVVEAKTPQFT